MILVLRGASPVHLCVCLQQLIVEIISPGLLSKTLPSQARTQSHRAASTSQSHSRANISCILSASLAEALAHQPIPRGRSMASRVAAVGLTAPKATLLGPDSFGPECFGFGLVWF